MSNNLSGRTKTGSFPRQSAGADGTEVERRSGASVRMGSGRLRHNALESKSRLGILVSQGSEQRRSATVVSTGAVCRVLSLGP